MPSVSGVTLLTLALSLAGVWMGLMSLMSFVGNPFKWRQRWSSDEEVSLAPLLRYRSPPSYTYSYPSLMIKTWRTTTVDVLTEMFNDNDEIDLTVRARLRDGTLVTGLLLRVGEEEVPSFGIYQAETKSLRIVRGADVSMVDVLDCEQRLIDVGWLHSETDLDEEPA